MIDPAVSSFLDSFDTDFLNIDGKSSVGQTGEQSRQKLLFERGQKLKGQAGAAGTSGIQMGASGVSTEKLDLGGLSMGAEGIGEKSNITLNEGGFSLDGKAHSYESKTPLSERLDQVIGIAGEAAGQLNNAMGLMGYANGDNFDTSAEGGGPGKQGVAILDGAQKGAQLGGKLGSIAGPIGQAIGQIVGTIGGGITGGVGQRKAVRQYQHNREEFNLNKNALERDRNKRDYAQQEGLASLEGLKSLREKQLGIISK